MENRAFPTENIISEKIQKYSVGRAFPTFEDADRAFIEEFMKRKIEEARAEGKKEGAQEVWNQIGRSYQEKTDSCLLKIAKILEVVNSVATSEKFKGTELAIKEVRIDFNPDPNKMGIKILFLIEASPEQCVNFAKDLILIETKFWELEKVPMSLFSINTKGASLDLSTIEADYPFRIKTPPA